MRDDPGSTRLPMAPFATLLARDDWPVMLGLPAIGAVFVFATPWLGWWAVVTAALVYTAGFVAFSRARDAHDTNLQLIRGLERLPELAGAVPTGAARATSHLAVQIGEELGVSGADLVMIDAISSCRDVGAVGYDELPHVRPGFDARAVARWSREVVSASARLDPVASSIGPDAGDDLVRIVDLAASCLDERRAGASRERAIRTAVERHDAGNDLEAAIRDAVV
jgi:hypothetical protein